MSRVISVTNTLAAASDDFTVTGIAKGVVEHAHLTAPGLAGSEVATIQKKNFDESYSDYYVAGVIQNITATNTGAVVDAAGIYRVNKGVTAAPVAIEISTPDSP